MSTNEGRIISRLLKLARPMPDHLMQKFWILREGLFLRRQRRGSPPKPRNESEIRKYLQDREVDRIVNQMYPTIERQKDGWMVSMDKIRREKARQLRARLMKRPPLIRTRDVRGRLEWEGKPESYRRLSDNLVEFHGDLELRFKIHIPYPTLKRLFHGRSRMTVPTRERLHKAFIEGKKSGIDIDGILKAWQSRIADQVPQASRAVPPTKANGRGARKKPQTENRRKKELTQATNDPLVRQLRLLMGNLTITEFHAFVCKYSDRNFSYRAVRTWVTGERSPSPRVRPILTRMIRFVRLCNLSCAKRIKGRTAT